MLTSLRGIYTQIMRADDNSPWILAALAARSPAFSHYGISTLSPRSCVAAPPPMAIAHHALIEA